MKPLLLPSNWHTVLRVPPVEIILGVGVVGLVARLVVLGVGVRLVAHLHLIVNVPPVANFAVLPQVGVKGLALAKLNQVAEEAQTKKRGLMNVLFRHFSPMFYSLVGVPVVAAALVALKVPVPITIDALIGGHAQ